jgi:ATP-dependent DNA ligase
MEVIMQCKPYTPDKMKYPVYGQVKMNGIFGRWDSNTRKLYTRSKKQVLGMSHLEQQLLNMPDLDGELVIPGMDFFKANGLIRNHEEIPECKFYVFDIPTARITVDRLNIYTKLINNQRNMTHVHPLKYHLINNESEADKFYQKVLDAGHEGVVYKSENSMYYKGKKWFVQKRVPEFTTECKVIGFQEGTKSWEGMLGAFIVDFNGVEVKVSGGQGIDFAFRQKVWDNMDKYLGLMMKVSYKSITEAGSMQSPKFVCFRWDLTLKSEED